MQISRITSLAFLALLAPSTPLLAQGLVYELSGTATSVNDFGRSVANAGDVDGDGVDDQIVGAPFSNLNGTNGGAVFVYSGATGDLLWSRAGEHAGDAFGWSVDGIGDITGDGKSEVIVGAPLWDNNGIWSSGSGKLYVISGTGSGTAFAVSINQLNAQLGTHVRGLGDIDGDGVGDIAFGAPLRDFNGLTDNGYFAVYSGNTLSFLFSRSGAESGARLGTAIDTVRNGGSQAWSRIIVGAPGVDGFGVDRGEARLMDGFGNLIIQLPGSTNGEWAGASVAGVGDLNFDGWEDYAVGSPFADILFVGADAGRVRIFSGANNTAILTPAGVAAGDNFGASLSACGDFNGDGRDDLLVGSPNADGGGIDSGEVRLVSGFNGGALATWFGGNNDHMGRSVSDAGDLNQDGLGDVLLGANDAPFGEGRAYVHLAGLAPSTTYCTAKVNSQGCTPQISVEGVASLSIANNCLIRATSVINQKFGIMFWGTDSNSSPFLDGTLCVQPPLQRTAPQTSGGNIGFDDCSGEYVFQFSHAYMANEGVAAGTRVHAQYWSRDPAASFQVGLTDAVSFDVVP